VSPGEPALPPVLLLHGWTLSADLNYFALYDELTSYRVIAPDHRGHGRGMRSRQAFSLEDCADDAAALLDVLGVGPAIMVGYSMGGAVAMLMWARHRERVAGLVLAATALEWRESARERLVWRGMSLFEVALRNGTGDGLVERVVRETIEEYPELEPYRDWAGGEFHRGYPVDLAGAGRALSAFDGREVASEVDVPCAVVVTTRDQLVRPRKQRQLAQALRAAVIEVNGDHAAPFNRAKPFGTAIRSGVERVAAGQPSREEVASATIRSARWDGAGS
jgi:3-oxoadipate enol-lactonase